MANLCIKTPKSATYVLIFQLLVLRPRPNVQLLISFRLVVLNQICPQVVVKMSPNCCQALIRLRPNYDQAPNKCSEIVIKQKTLKSQEHEPTSAVRSTRLSNRWTQI